MTPIAILLVILSAVMHAGWNLLSKRHDPSPSFFLVACLSGALLLSPFVWLYGGVVVPDMTARIWAFLLAAGFFLALYYVSLAGAYRAGDMSVAYPMARSAPIVVVTAVTLILGRGDQVSVLCLAGMVLVVAGCFLIPLKRLGDLSLRSYVKPICGLALLAAIGTAGYSIMDDEALRLLRSRTTIGNTRTTLVYAGLEALAASAWLFLFVMLRREGRIRRIQWPRVKIPVAMLAGLAIFFSYALVLLALSFVDNVSYVVSFRQISIPLGAVSGILVLKEVPYGPKVSGVIVMFVGLILVAMG